MAEVHRFKSSLSRLDIEMIADDLSGVAGTLGVLTMIANKIDDNEMVVDPHEFAGMVELMRRQLARSTQRLRTAL